MSRSSRPSAPLAGRAAAAARTLAAGLALGTAFVSACGSEPPGLVAGPVSYTRSEVLGLSESRLAALADLTALGVAVQRAEVDRLAGPAIRAWEGQELLPELLRVERVLADNGVTDANLEALYATDPEYELTVRHLIVLSERYETDETRAQARAKAERALARIQAGEPFPAVAAEVSEEPGAEGREGLLNPGRQGAWVDEFWSAASALEVGEISPVVETQYGFHVLRLEDRQPVPFAEVRSRVAARAASMIPGAGEVELGLDDPAALRPDYSVSGELAPDASPGDASSEEDPVRSDPAQVLASWAGGQVTRQEAMDARAGLEVLGLEGTGSAIDAAARWKMLADSVKAAGLAPDPARLEAFTTEWVDRLEGWGRQMGFSARMSEEELKAAALTGLSATGQLFQVTRRELEQTRPLLRRYLDLVTAEGGR